MPEIDLRSRLQPFPEYDAIRAHPETYPLKQIIEHVNQTISHPVTIGLQRARNTKIQPSATGQRLHLVEVKQLNVRRTS